MQNKILEQGKGLLEKIAVDSINGFDAFKSKRNKRLFIDILMDEAGPDVVLIAYCILDSSAHFIIKSSSKADSERYVANVMYRFGKSYDSGKTALGYPLRGNYVCQKINSKSLLDAISYVHGISPVAPDLYEFNSYGYLMKGEAGAVRIIIVESGGELTRAKFTEWLARGSKKKYKASFSGKKEKFNAVLVDIKKNYLGKKITEETLVFILADICDRTRKGYKKAARAMGVKYKAQRDVMIGTLCDMMSRRGRSFYDSVTIMKLFKENRNTLLLDCIVEYSRLHQYSYDHIISMIGVNDYYYDLLVEILKGLHEKYKYNFEELCLKFHLQHEILSIRSRCGF